MTEKSVKYKKWILGWWILGVRIRLCAINRGFLRACCGYIRFSMRPCTRLKNPNFSSQNKGHRSALADVSLEILESFASFFTILALILESTFATLRLFLCHCETSARKSWQSI
ncbi:hypothetical protein [Helicobacter canis]|uniref:Uncharacterized protein n=1 Tax=Helicobacter canis TaxID=29419 RepID=A0A5M9QLA0_9HELI|nr:hypothetical protein [Helicobacter canis]KAA8708516.1 hypothetical protein F4V45_06235 [Helicobacter canis]